MQENLPVSNIPTPDPEISTAAPQPVYEKPKTNNFLVGLLSVLLILATLIAGFFAYQTQQLVKELQVMRSEQKQVAEPTAEPVVTIEPTDDWKTYTGKIFSFKYPDGMTLKSQDIQDPSNTSNIGDMVLLSDSKYSLQVSSNFLGGWGGNPCLEIKNKTVDGIDSQIMYFGKSETGTGFCLDQYEGLVAIIGNKMGVHPYPILIELQSINDPKVVELSLFDQVLSTFEFIN